MGQAHYRPKTDRKPTQYSTGRAAAEAAVNGQVADGLACGLGSLGWYNLLNWGSGNASLNGGWGCVSGDLADQCGMSPSEILDCGRALLANPTIHGITLWSFEFSAITTSNDGYWGLPDIKSALLTIYNESGGRNDGPQNVRSGANKHLDAA
jgi:hypothetical protein